MFRQVDAVGAGRDKIIVEKEEKRNKINKTSEPQRIIASLQRAYE
jgi:hypothetical protein